MFANVRSELTSFLPKEKAFILFVMLADFLISAEYGITRPASNSLFLAAFSSSALPWIWLATVPLNLLAVSLYNRFLGKLGPLRMLGTIAVLIVVVNSSTALFLEQFPSLIFLQFMWKDIYILFMYKQLWSLTHSTLSQRSAKYVYGLLFGVGTLGSIVGGLVPGLMAVRLGSEHIFWFTLPCYIALWFSYRKAYSYSQVAESPFQPSQEGLRALFNSRLLVSVLLLVVLMQASVGLMEFQFNMHLEQHILDKDLRTEYVGRLLSLTNVISLFFQLIGSALLVHTLGVRRSHLMIPILLLANALWMISLPTFAVLAGAFVFIKAVDFSLFGVIREMLYIPMRMDEKFRAKAVIDVFAYRSAKALVAVSVLVLQAVAGTMVSAWVNGAIVAVFVLWLGVVWFLFRRAYTERALP